MPKHSKLPDLFGRSPLSFWVVLGVLLLLVLAFFARPVPYGNEFVYLLRLEPGFLPNDWTFSQGAHEHWLFNAVFSIPAMFMSIEAVGWVGRIVFWVLCLAGFIKLGEHWKIPHWTIAVSIALWIVMNQSLVNDEWIFGGFEAKLVSYACLLFALHGFALRRIALASILLGLSFSFHPAVALWAIPAIGIALVFVPVSFRDLMITAGLTLLFCLPGILPLIGEQVAETASYEDWKFIVTVRMPFHFDPFSFSPLRMALLGVMFAVNLAVMWRTESFALRFLRNFQIAIAAFFLFGVILRAIELYPLLRFMPMRLFPVLTPLFFCFTAVYFIFCPQSRPRKFALALCAIAIIGLLDPFDNTVEQLRETRNRWTAKPDSLETALMWVSQNTPPDAVVITPPGHRRQWYFSRRAHIVSWNYPRYDRMAEWRERISDVTGGVPLSTAEDPTLTIEKAYSHLSAEQILEMQQKYSADYLVSPAIYPFPVIFETETHKVYRLQQ